MVVLWVIGGVLPQTLILLVLGAQLGIFGGWHNTTIEFLGLLVVLFSFSPIVTAALLIIETVRYRKIGRGQRGPSWWIPGLALVLFVEALAIDGFILSQLGWWLDEMGFGM